MKNNQTDINAIHGGDMADGYLSQDAARIAASQRARRAQMVRIDYMPGAGALAIIKGLRRQVRPNSPAQTNSALLDAIVTEWATLAGIECGSADPPKKPRTTCGARRHRDGQPCRARPEPSKQRCRFHGGRSTGPRTPEGKARALGNLRQYRPVTLTEAVTPG